MKQTGLAVPQYAQDANECYPSGVNPGNRWFWAGEGWAGQYAPYAKSAALALRGRPLCPLALSSAARICQATAAADFPAHRPPASSGKSR